ncbi:fms interacting protein [Aphelenchoides avenae]|nr:fms interacting protein [Aphelenchus avenae]
MAPVRSTRDTSKARTVDPLPTASLTAFLRKEDEIAGSKPREQVISEFQALTDSIRSEIEDGQKNAEKWDDQSTRDKLLVGAIQMRRLNRLSNYRIKHLRERTGIARGQLDSQFLLLQNIKSEISHLKKTIDSCLEFRSSDADVELVPVEEFYKNAPESVSNPEKTRNDPHEQHLAQLNYELQERKNLMTTLHELDGRKQVLLSDIRGKESRLGQIKPRITSLKDAAKPLLDILGLKSVSGSSVEVAKRTTLLAKELQLLHVNANVYNDLFEDEPIEILCEGDTVLATKNMENQKKDLTEEESDEDADADDLKDDETEADEAATKKHRKRKGPRRENEVSDKLQRKRERLLAADPMSVSLVIPSKDTKIKVKVTFLFLTELKSIAVKCNVDGDVTNRQLFDTATLLDELLEGDTGERGPSSHCDTMFKLMDLQPLTYTPIIGKLYRFAQVICGMPADATQAATTTQSIEVSTPSAPTALHQFETFVQVLERIRSRVSSRVALSKRLVELESLKMQKASPSSFNRFVPQKVVSRLTSLKAITSETYESTQVRSDVHRKLLKTTGASERGFQYHIRVERADFVLGALVHIHPDYPHHAPVFTLTIRSGKHQSNSSYIASVQELEQYLNLRAPQLLDDDELNDLFPLQVALLVSRLDVALEIASCRLRSKDFELEHIYRSYSSGRKQRLPFEYDVTTRAFFTTSKPST